MSLTKAVFQQVAVMLSRRDCSASEVRQNDNLSLFLSHTVAVREVRRKASCQYCLLKRFMCVRIARSLYDSLY